MAPQFGYWNIQGVSKFFLSILLLSYEFLE